MNSRLLDTNTQRLALLLVWDTFLQHLLLLTAWEQPTRQVKLSLPHKDTSLRHQVATILLQKSNRKPQVRSNLQALIYIHKRILQLGKVLFSRHNSAIRLDIMSLRLYPHTTRIISIRLAPLQSILGTTRPVTTQRLRVQTRVRLQNHKSITTTTKNIRAKMGMHKEESGVKQASSEDRQTCNITNKNSVGKGGASRGPTSGEHTNHLNVWARFWSHEFQLV
jgi:hypothetical protein